MIELAEEGVDVQRAAASFYFPSPLPPPHFLHSDCTVQRTILSLNCSYILFCVHFQTNSSLVWKKIKILTTCFPNQFQFGLEKNYNFDDSFSKPIPVWFGKNDHFSETKNSKLIPHFFGKT